MGACICFYLVFHHFAFYYLVHFCGKFYVMGHEWDAEKAAPLVMSHSGA